jgi:nitroreductase
MRGRTMDVWEAIKGRRSVRSYEDRPVEKEVLMKLFEAGIWAPTAGNLQTWRFVIVTTKEMMRKIKMVSPGLLGDPPAVIAICQDMEEVRRRASKLGVELVQMDTAMCAQNIMLTAYALNLGTCAVGSFHQKAVHRLLHLPEKIVPQLLVSIGYPKKIPPPPPRKTEGIYFFEEYHG